MIAPGAVKRISGLQSQPASKRKIRPTSVAVCASEIIAALDEQWLPRLYIERILTTRTRPYHLEIQARASQIKIQASLLGVELKVGRRRMLCPDVATARYLAVFARMGCRDVAMPYDITRIARLSGLLEAASQSMQMLMNERATGRNASFRSRLEAALKIQARREIADAGSGRAIPEFNQNTKQRARPGKKG